jgi:hypothetical protein
MSDELRFLKLKFPFGKTVCTAETAGHAEKDAEKMFFGHRWKSDSHR